MFRILEALGHVVPFEHGIGFLCQALVVWAGPWSPQGWVGAGLALPAVHPRAWPVSIALMEGPQTPGSSSCLHVLQLLALGILDLTLCLPSEGLMRA